MSAFKAWCYRHVTISYKNNSIEHRLGLDISITGRLRTWIDAFLLDKIRAYEATRYGRFLDDTGIRSQFVGEAKLAGTFEERHSPGSWWDALPSSAHPKVVRRTVNDAERQHEMSLLRRHADAERSEILRASGAFQGQISRTL